MTAIFRPEGPLFRATEHAGGPWSPEMLQGSATTALMTREVTSRPLIPFRSKQAMTPHRRPVHHRRPSHKSGAAISRKYRCG